MGDIPKVEELAGEPILLTSICLVRYRGTASKTSGNAKSSYNFMAPEIVSRSRYISSFNKSLTSCFVLHLVPSQTTFRQLASTVSPRQQYYFHEI